MSDDRDLNAIFDRIAKRNFTDGDIHTLRHSVVIGGNVHGATIVTGDDNILGGCIDRATVLLVTIHSSLSLEKVIY